jgi:hypothetical protein
MNYRQQRQLDALRRVQDFLDSHAADVGALNDCEARTQLDDAVTQLAAFGNDQGTANLQMTGQIHRERAMAVDLRHRHMQPIATFARARLRGAPDFAALARPASNKLLRTTLVRAARAMAAAAAPHADALTKGGFPADAVAQLGAAADALSATVAERANTKVRRVGATKGIAEELRRGGEAAAMLHAVIHNQFTGDATFLAGWNAARRVAGKPGVVHTVAVAPVSVPLSLTATPPSPANATNPSAAQAAA